jgi:hypothetical protein
MNRADQQQHSDMIGVRQAIGSLDKRVSILEVQQHNTDSHLQELRLEIQDISKELKSIGRELVGESRSLQRQFHGHVVQEDADRIKLLRGQRQTIITVILAAFVASVPYLVDYLRHIDGAG